MCCLFVTFYTRCREREFKMFLRLQGSWRSVRQKEAVAALGACSWSFHCRLSTINLQAMEES